MHAGYNLKADKGAAYYLRRAGLRDADAHVRQVAKRDVVCCPRGRAGWPLKLLESVCFCSLRRRCGRGESAPFGEFALDVVRVWCRSSVVVMRGGFAPARSMHRHDSWMVGCVSPPSRPDCYKGRRARVRGSSATTTATHSCVTMTVGIRMQRHRHQAGEFDSEGHVG